MSSPTKGKRKSLVELFSNLDMAESSSSVRSSSVREREKIHQQLRQTIIRGWPSVSPNEASMTIRSDDVYRQYARGQDPEDLFKKATNWLSTIQKSFDGTEQHEIIVKEVNDSMTRAIFGSNMIERAGLGWDITVQLCRMIFAGEDVGEITERDPAYQDALLELRRKQPELKNMPAYHILRGRSEIVQHAKAYQHIIHGFVIQKQDLSEELIKETHRILTKGVPVIQKGQAPVHPEEYGGIYRTIPVCAGNTNFTVPQFVPVKMKQMCSALKKDLESASEKGGLDPFSIATKYSLEFVQIHPFPGWEWKDVQNDSERNPLPILGRDCADWGAGRGQVGIYVDQEKIKCRDGGSWRIRHFCAWQSRNTSPRNEEETFWQEKNRLRIRLYSPSEFSRGYIEAK